MDLAKPNSRRVLDRLVLGQATGTILSARVIEANFGFLFLLINLFEMETSDSFILQLPIKKTPLECFTVQVFYIYIFMKSCYTHHSNLEK